MRMGFVCVCWVSQLHSCNEWQKGKALRICTIIFQCAFITGLRQWTIFSLSSLWVGWGHLCCTGLVRHLPNPQEIWFWLHLRDLPCQVVPLHQVPFKCFPALNPKIILGWHLPPPLHGAPITYYCCRWPLGLHEEDVTPASLSDSASWPRLSRPANSWVALPAQGKHLRAPALLASGLASAACWQPCPSSYAFLSVRAN